MWLRARDVGCATYTVFLEGAMVAADWPIRSCDQGVAGFLPVVGMVSALVDLTLRFVERIVEEVSQHAFA